MGFDVDPSDVEATEDLADTNVVRDVDPNVEPNVDLDINPKVDLDVDPNVDQTVLDQADDAKPEEEPIPA